MKLYTPTRYRLNGRAVLPGVVLFLSTLCPLKAGAVTYLVNSLADANAGAGTSGDLRYCINQANAVAGPHIINFNGLSGTITLTGDLPVFTRQISVMGNTGAGYTTAPVIEINASAAGWGFLFNAVGGANSVIRALTINRAQFTNIDINSVNNITVRDCYIGLNMAGIASAGTNPTFGIQCYNSVGTQILNNVISGHATHGILLNNGSNNNIIRGNKIGTNAAGNAAIANTFHGIEITNASTGNTIGGTGAGEGNLISGNGEIGISIVNTSTGTQVIANYIGVNATGTAAIANGIHGVYSENCGAVTITNNVISGNTIFGVLLRNADGHIIRGNKVGTNAAGTAAIGNGNAGISIFNGDNVTIGGTGAGEGNVLSGNGDVGLRFEASATATIQGNYIGTNATGTGAIANATMGIFATTDCNNHLIGGNTAAARNIISANTINGIQYTTNSHDLIITGNYIGTDATGGGAAATFGNGQIGIKITDNCLRTNVGGTTVAQRNIISGNGRLWPGSGGNGTAIQFEGGVHNGFIRGNYIGVAADGTTSMPNRENGIVILGGDNVTIGGNSAATRNVIASCGFQGIVVQANTALIIGNYIGVDATGTVARGNGQSGVILIFSNGSTIGRANAGEGNVISNNGEEGIHLVGGTANVIYNNYIGVAANGTTPMGNANGGVFIIGVAGFTNGSQNTVGGVGLLEPNIIAYSTGTGSNTTLGNGFGVGVAHNEQGIQNTIRGNKIFCNAGLGIDLNFLGLHGGGANAAGNGGKPAPTITAVSATVTSGTGIAGEVIHVYSNVTCTTCQGENYLGSAIVTAGGTWSLTHVSVTTPANNSATATSTALGTSQFSCNTALPVTLISFTAELKQKDVLLQWTTVSEINNERFEIERSSDGINFETIGSEKGKGNYAGLSNYSFTDYHSLPGISYYRLKQFDYNGAFEYSVVKTIQRGFLENVLYPNPTDGELYLDLTGFGPGSGEVSIHNVLGAEVWESTLTYGQSLYYIDMSSYAEGVYIITVTYAQQTNSYRIIKQ